MPIDEPSLPLFLGVTRRAARRGYEWDLLGVTTLLLFPFFPQQLIGLQCILGLNRSTLASQGKYSYRLLFTDESNPTHQAWLDQELSFISGEAGQVMPLGSAGFTIPLAPPGGSPTVFQWNLVGTQVDPESIEILVAPCPPLLVWQPCRVCVDVEVNGSRYHRGEFLCGFIPPPPLTDDERRAIASRPGAAKSVTFHVECNICGNEAHTIPN